MTIKITRSNTSLWINPAPPYVIDYLYYKHKEIILDKTNWKRKPNFVRTPLFSSYAQGGVITLPGFFESLCDLVKKNYDDLETVDYRTPLPAIDWARIKKVGLRDYQIPQIIDIFNKGVNNSGIVLGCGGLGKTFIAAGIYAGLHNLNTILAIPIAQVAADTYKKFKKVFPEKHVGLVMSGSNDISPDITIATFQSLKKCALEKCQLLITDEIQCCTSPTFQQAYSQMSPIRSFGLTATDKGMYNQAEKVLTGLFGERLIEVTYSEGQELGAVVPCQVYMVKIPESADIFVSGLDEAMLEGIRLNEFRNKLIGDICKLAPADWQTLVFVDMIEDHLVNVLQYMPEGTKFIHRGTSKKKLGQYALSPKQQAEISKAFQANEIKKLIATDCLRAGFDCPNIRLVVQGAGGSAPIEVVQEALRGSRVLKEEDRLRLGVEEKTHFVLVDFVDKHHSSLNKMSKDRMKSYHEQGWSVQIVDHPSEIDFRRLPGMKI